ncbi:MAG TPA: type III-B CRISPR module RAMP protein Cmr6 [Ktedonobacteraceae bacterium]|nr:type III-B CRISPR module RAMP protein Cmr6 [Ktedonobacteraceae bacterium]
MTSGLRNCFKSPLLEEYLKHQPHAGLWHDKFLSNQESKDDTKSRQLESGDNNKSPRMTLVKEVADIVVPDAYTSFYDRWKEALGAVDAKCFEATVTGRVISTGGRTTTTGRLIVGLGMESVLETGIALHHTYGVPYLPGSALKGLTTSYMQRIREKLKPAGEQADAAAYEQINQAYKVIFGDTDDAGYITFFDALYIPGTGYNGQPLHPDIITVHHQEYYQHGSKAAPADWDSPIPVPFLSATGSYLVALAAPDIKAASDTKEGSEREQWLSSAGSLLRAALKHMGIGAKTSSGYGRMDLDEIKPPVDPLARRIQGSIKEVNAIGNHAVSGQIQNHFHIWRQVKDHPKSNDLALAIVQKVRSAGKEGTEGQKPYYKELLAFLGSNFA